MINYPHLAFQNGRTMFHPKFDEGAALAPFGVRLAERDGALQPAERDGALQAACSPGLRRYAIRGADGRRLGDLYGVILTRLPVPDVVIAGDEIRVSVPVPDIRAFEVRVLDRLQGTFVVTTHGDLPRRVYPDAGATLPVVFCPRTRRIGSSAAMILDAEDYARRFLALRHRRLLGTAHHSWLPGTLTVHEGVARLLPNHYLDLETWEARRFWPRPGEAALTLTAAEAAQRVAAGLRAFMAAAAEEFRVGVALTGGLDSRLLLAGSRAVAGQMEFFTITPERPGLDQILAARLAAGLGLRHRLVPQIPASAAETEAWDRAVGHAVREGANSRVYPTLRRLGYDVILTGAFGATGKGSYYAGEHATIDDRPLTAPALLARMSCPQDAELAADLERWLAGLEGLPASAILDLAYFELRSVGWSTAQHAAQCALQLEMNPIAQRGILEAFLAVPPAQKADKALLVAAVAQMWPELMDYPLNRFGDYRDPLGRVLKVFDRERLRRYLHKRRAR
jgi:hypothetical protein